MGRAPTALRAALRDGERVLPRHDLGARRRGRALLDAALDQLVLPEQVEHVVHGVVGRRLLAKICMRRDARARQRGAQDHQRKGRRACGYRQPLLCARAMSEAQQKRKDWSGLVAAKGDGVGSSKEGASRRQLQRGSPHGDLVAPQLERLVEQDGAGEDAGGAAPRVQVGVDALLRHAVEQLDLLQAEHEVIDPAGQAADEEGLEVTQRPPREELPREADRRDEYEVMKVVRPGEAEAAAAAHKVGSEGGTAGVAAAETGAVASGGRREPHPIMWYTCTELMIVSGQTDALPKGDESWKTLESRA
eukprot:6122057-Prymnesium_polylepis.1